MDLYTATRLLPLLSETQGSNSPKSRLLSRSSLSPLPPDYNLVYREMVLKEKEFIRRNKYAQRLAYHFASPRTIPASRKEGKTGRNSPFLLRGKATLGVSGLSAVQRSVQKPNLRSTMDQYNIHDTWVSLKESSHRRVVSIAGTRRTVSPKAHMDETGKKQVTTVTLSLAATKVVDSPAPLRAAIGDDTAHSHTFDSSLVRSRPPRVRLLRSTVFPRI